MLKKNYSIRLKQTTIDNVRGLINIRSNILNNLKKNFVYLKKVKNFQKNRVLSNLKKIQNNFLTNPFNTIKKLSKNRTRIFNTFIRLSLSNEIKNIKIKNKIFLNIINSIKNLLYRLRKIAKTVFGCIKRLIYCCLIYALPFLTLSHLAFSPYVVYKYIYPVKTFYFTLLSNSLKAAVEKLVDLATPFATEQTTVLFFALLFYLRVFAFSSDKFNIPLPIAYQGSMAMFYLLISYILSLMNIMLAKPIFQAFLVAKAFFDRIALENSFGLAQDWLDGIYFDLTDEIALQFSHKYYNLYAKYIIFLGRDFTGFTSFIILCTLLYNICYYVLKNKNPEIFFISNVANRMLKKRGK